MKGQFKNIENKLYTVEINKYPNTTITLADEPFIINMDSDNLFSHIKSRTATCRIITNKKLGQLYSSKANDVSITLTDENNTTVFAGYVTPNVYNQSWVSDGDVLEIESTDAVSILKYYDYKKINTESAVSFNSIICSLLRKCGVYNTMYVAASVRFQSNFFMDDLYIEEENFYNDDDEKKAWKCSEVLEETLKFFNLSLVVYNNDVYLLDYEYINAGLTDFYKVDINTEGYTIVQLSDTYTIIGNSHKDVDTNLSLDSTYNQITISCNTYPFGDIYQDPYKNLIEVGHSVMTRDNDVYNYYYYKSPKWIQYFYDNDTKLIAEPLVFDDNTLQHFYGALITKRIKHPKENPPSTPNWEKIIILRNNIPDKVDKPYLSFTSESKQIFASVDPEIDTSFLCITGQIMFSCLDKLIVSDNYRDECSHRISIPKGGIKNAFQLTLQIGDKYWNTELGKWQTEPVITYIPFGEEGNFVIDQWNNFTNNVAYWDNLEGGDAYAIPIKNSDALYGNLIMTIYSPNCPTEYGRVAYSKFSGIKDVKIEFRKPVKDKNLPSTDDEDKNDDIIYKNVIDDEYVNEFDDIQLKINTQTELKNTKSAVIVKNGNGFTFLRKLTNVVNNVCQLQEENIIQTYYNHYKQPKNIVDITMENKLTPYSQVIENNLQSTMLVNTISNDIYNNNITAQLIEF